MPKLLFALLPLAIGSSAQATLPACDNDIQNSSIAISPDERTAVASCSQRPEVIVYDLYARKVRRVLDDFIKPRKILFEPNGRYFYISDSGFGVVKKIDSVSLQTVSVLYAIPGALGITMSNDGRTLYVDNEEATVVSVFDLVTQQRIAQITAYSQKPLRASPQDASFLYLADFCGQEIRILDTTTNQITGEISGFNKIRAFSATRDGKTLLVVDTGAQSVAVVDIPSRRIVVEIPLGSSSDAPAMSRDQRFACFHDPRDNSLAVVAVLPCPMATNPGFLEPAQGMVFSRDGSAAYVLGRDLSISRIDLSDNRIAYTIATRPGARPTQRLQPVIANFGVCCKAGPHERADRLCYRSRPTSKGTLCAQISPKTQRRTAPSTHSAPARYVREIDMACQQYETLMLSDRREEPTPASVWYSLTGSTISGQRQGEMAMITILNFARKWNHWYRVLHDRKGLGCLDNRDHFLQADFPILIGLTWINFDFADDPEVTDTAQKAVFARLSLGRDPSSGT